MLIDTHCHLNFKAFDKDLDKVIERAETAGIEKIVIPGAKIDSSRKAINISQKYNTCFAAVGIHPHHSSEVSILGLNTIHNTLHELTKEKKIVSIGEIGIDYYHYKNYPPLSEFDKKSQQELFITQLKVAQAVKLPVIIHCRQAHEDLFEILKSYISYNDYLLTGVFHCFGGNTKYLKKALELGFFVGFDGNCTYQENIILKNLIKETPLERLVLETDSPFLTPVAFRKSRNEPSYLKYIAAEIARIHGISYELLSEITFHNALKLFRFF